MLQPLFCNTAHHEGMFQKTMHAGSISLDVVATGLDTPEYGAFLAILRIRASGYGMKKFAQKEDKLNEKTQEASERNVYKNDIEMLSYKVAVCAQDILKKTEERDQILE